MNDLIAFVPRILAEVRSAWRFRWYGAAVAWALCFTGWTVVAIMPNVYQASATVYVDTSSFLKPILTNQIVTPDVVAQLTYVHQALLGREHLEQIAHEDKLDTNVKTPADLNRVLSKLLHGIVIETRPASGTPGNVVANISYRNSSRETALSVVSSLTNSLVEGTLGATQAGTDTASKFVDDRIEEYDARLQKAEEALAHFKKTNADRLPGAEGGYFERIRTENAGLQNAERSLRLAQSKVAQLRAQLAGSSPITQTEGLDKPLPANSIDARIREAQTKLDSLLLGLTEKHPDVIGQREVLRQLVEQRADQLRALGITNPNQELSGLGSSPVYQALQIALNEAQVDVATISSDVEERKQRLASLQKLVNEVPEVEAELARLNRDYEVIYAQYQGLIKSRETQSLSEKASATNHSDFRIINPPLADFDPVAPNRVLFLTGVLVTALGLGGALCSLLALTHPVFSSAKALREALGLPVIGVVSQALSRRHRMRRLAALASFVAAIGTLGFLFLAGVAIEVMGSGIHTWWGRI